MAGLAVREVRRGVGARLLLTLRLWASLPRAGPVYAARLTAAMGTARDRWTTGDERLCFSGGGTRDGTPWAVDLGPMAHRRSEIPAAVIP
jgi:hypothetical protein